MRPIDADMLQELYNKRIFDTWNNETAPVSWAATYADFKDDIDSILTIPQPGNEPLTLEELWEMNEEPVWVQNLEEPGKSQWRLLYWDRGKHLCPVRHISPGLFTGRVRRILACLSLPTGEKRQN